MTDARELWFAAPRHVEVRTAAIPRPLPGQVLVRAVASGISQGSELLLFRGEGPTPFDPSLGVPGTYPCRYGYAWVGVVESDGPETGELEPGQLVFALAPHGSHHALDVTALRLLDPEIPALRAVLAANLETAVTCVWDTEAVLGDEVVVLGAGVVGLLVAWLLLRVGCRVRVVDPSSTRRAMARAIGAEDVAPERDSADHDADVVVEATGDPASLDRAIAHARAESTIVVASFYGSRRAPIDLGSDFHRRRLVLRASQVSQVPVRLSRRWSLERRFELVHRLLHEQALDQFVSRVAPFETAPDTYAQLDLAPGDAIQTVFTYDRSR
jgi:2-desacetyl-2-hydroxyethyl bacteriochlorophyllide A dehydrogenase